MSIAQECLWALWRAVVVALPAVGLAWLVVGCVERGSAGRRWWRGVVMWGLLLAPLLTPTLLTAYAYRPIALSWVREPMWAEWLYRAILLARGVPVAVLIVWVTPAAPVGPAAQHAAKLAGRHRSLGMVLRGSARRLIVAGAAVMLLTFVEFEIAWLLDARTWTTVIFDAQAARVPLDATLRLTAVPLACQAAVLTPIVWMLLRDGRRGTAEPMAERRRHPLATAAGWAYLPLGAAVGCGYPLYVIGAGAVRGWSQLMRQDLTLGTLQQLGWGVRQGAIAAAVTVTAALVLRRYSRGPVALAACVPGLFGPLVVAMAVMAAFQTPLLRGQYDTVLPLTVAHGLWLLPIAVLLVALLGPRHAGATHLATMLRQAEASSVRRSGRRLLAHAWLRPMVWVAFIVFCLAYFELTATALLAPAGATPGTVMAYNNMHYGQYDVLAARVAMNLVLAAGLVGLIGAISRFVISD